MNKVDAAEDARELQGVLKFTPDEVIKSTVSSAAIMKIY